MNMKNIMLGMLAVCGVFTACGDDDFEEVKSALTVTSAVTSVDAAGGETAIHVDGPVASVYANKSWIAPSYANGVVSLKVSENGDMQSRSGIVVIKASAEDSTIVNISQLGMRYDASEVPAKLSVFGHAEATAKVKYICNVSTKFTCSEWIHGVAEGDSLVFTFDTNDGAIERTGTIDFVSGGMSSHIDVTQYNLAGNGTVSGTDRQGNAISLAGAFVAGEDGSQLLFKPTQYENVSIPFTMNATTGELTVNAGSRCGTNGSLNIFVIICDLANRPPTSYDPAVSMSGAVAVNGNAFTVSLGDNGSWAAHHPTMLRLGTSRGGASGVNGNIADIINPIVAGTK